MHKKCMFGEKNQAKTVSRGQLTVKNRPKTVLYFQTRCVTTGGDN